MQEFGKLSLEAEMWLCLPVCRPKLIVLRDDLCCWVAWSKLLSLAELMFRVLMFYLE